MIIPIRHISASNRVLGIKTECLETFLIVFGANTYNGIYIDRTNKTHNIRVF